MSQCGSPFRSSIPVLLLQFFLKGVMVHLVHLYDRKLQRASSVTLDKLLCISLPIDDASVGDLPSIMFSGGGSRSGSNHFRLEFGFIRFSPFCPLFVGSFQVQFAFFSVRPWKDGLSFRPVETVWLFLQVRGRLRLAQNAFYFCWMRLRVFGRCSLHSLHSYAVYCVGIRATSGSTVLVAISAALIRGAPFWCFSTNG
jgi:hypothetical protein